MRRLCGWRLGCSGRAIGEGALEPAADVSSSLALGGTFGYVGSGGSWPGQYEGTIEVPVASTAQSVSSPVAAAEPRRGDQRKVRLPAACVLGV